jgi:DNA-binding NarL/FixJ family response regulator
MMEVELHILFIDDHPTIIEGYKSILTEKYTSNQVQVAAAYSSEAGYEKLFQSNKIYDLVVLDIGLPAYATQRIESGEDLAFLIQKHYPQTKILISTSHLEAIILYNIVKKVNPDGLMIKSDFKSDEFISAIDKVLQGEIYYSQTVRNAIKEVAQHNDALDSIDRRIVSLLSKGIKTKSIPSHLGISLSAVDKRKAQIKDFFNIVKGTDEDIIREATKRGLI